MESDRDDECPAKNWLGIGAKVAAIVAPLAFIILSLLSVLTNLQTSLARHEAEQAQFRGDLIELQDAIRELRRK